MIPAIRVSGLVKTYPARPPVEAVRGLDLEVNVGECFGLLGPNGAGKTTTLEIIEGLLDPTAGEVEILGLKWGTNDTEIRNKIGISLQETRLSDKLTVRETVTLFRSFYSVGIAPDEAIGRVSLEEKVNAYVDKLSGGQRQRLAVATALVGDPELLFLDEPTTGLDPQSRRQLWDVIRSIKERGRTVVITTHYMDEAERLCDRVAVIDHGKVIALGTPAELIARVGGEHVIDLDIDPTSSVHPRTAELSNLPTVNSVREEGDHVTITASEPHRALPALLDLVRTAGVKIAGLTTRTATLEDVFVTLTGRHLRDES
ncbi:abc transporter atpase : ABC-type multidrug transport system, ATPase component OS=Singulisphaera acidiphila (strain ATCC BAA-1392 / DSM 18658 / VKM B-2454 / MOB10) GN=Sinac_1472 PE=3 SV=1: ABC_tran [Gemmata massiliana]|uniref:ABC transporter domain-containing protein n=1 Tax=Gemmata massiliana TaxID=1210884 RepID=A0A6P2CZI4_9BACT|nr:ABC transporter ATP-binding protein [Gemmata massiliana]VTR92630.1 abc transporter atpase : ABC-type multidrug transport system, ATPase component OS=Singulisphaera acidiphila (strain ATCC BAA-1392 / DSM 18658 / VKM B-2454 / MOB10) GN=Sinac_1472 PE=3 SV=1: ABC_tran [Gemmata massiliana]